MKGYDRKALLDIARASPAAVARHDKEAWVGLFAGTSIIEDPVGSRPHVGGIFDFKSGSYGKGPITRFFETFIEPNEIGFHVVRDVVAGNTVGRDLEIEIRMSPEVAVRVPMHVFYELREEDGALGIFRLAAHWEIVPMVQRVFRFGWPGVRAMNQLGMRMLQKQGLGGALGFSRAIFGIGKRGKQCVSDFVDCVNGRDVARLRQLFHGPEGTIEFPVGMNVFAVSDFLDRTQPQLSVSKLLSAGYTTTFSFTVNLDGAAHSGIARFEFNAKSKRLERARFFWGDVE